MKNIFTFCLILIPLMTFSQAQLLPLNNNIMGRYDFALYQKESNFHTASKPYLASDVRQITLADSVSRSLYSGSRSFFWDYLKNDHLVEFQRRRLKVTADPVIDALPGIETDNNAFRYEALYGASLNLSVSDQFHFNATLSQGFARFPTFIDSMVRAEEVVPGRSFAIPLGDDFRFRNNSGYASYSPGKYFNFQMGYGRNFIGDGYRSLLLSDNAYSSPYAKVTTNIWKIQYVNLFTNFQDIRSTGGDRSNFYNKYGVFHYLSWNITERLNIGLFESIIFENRDTTGQRFTYDVHYLNPVIFYRPVEYAMGSADNVLMGMNIKYNLFKKQVLYGQVMIDEFLLRELRADALQAVVPDPDRRSGWWANKYGFQVGMKWFDFLWINNLMFQAEHNLVRPYSYTHSSVYQNYGHYNQPIAHPLGANFREYLAIMRYYYNRFSVEAKVVHANFGDDSPDVYYGRDIFQSYRDRPSEHGHFIGQGVQSSMTYSELKFSYLVNTKSNLQVQAGIINRHLAQEGRPSQNTNFIFAGLRTSLFNWYYDR